MDIEEYDVNMDVDHNDFIYLSDEDYQDMIELNSNYSQLIVCGKGVLESLQFLIVKLISFAVIKRILVALNTAGKLNEYLLNAFIAGGGLFMLWTHNSDTFLCIITFIALLLPIVYLTPFISAYRYSELISVSFGITSLLFWCQFDSTVNDADELRQYSLTAEMFLSIRGTLMIVIMKLVSICCDIVGEQSSSWNEIDLTALIAYFLDPCTVLFGPWISFSQYKRSLQCKSFKEQMKDIIYGIFLVAISLIFVLYSSCITELIFPRNGFWSSFGIAQSFRFSHYFVSSLSHASAVAAGISISPVTDYISIELPR
ncbi:unnamed protein product, partial [Anisakis simplex]|uniref:Pecanex-like protein n=1 Tax=Anisakis simplex TaxID=6269 RepID=A0A0M3KAI4_ANISI